MLTLTPTFANFVYEIGQQLTLNSQTIQIGTTGGQIPFTISVPSTTGAQVCDSESDFRRCPNYCYRVSFSGHVKSPVSIPPT